LVLACLAFLLVGLLLENPLLPWTPRAHQNYHLPSSTWGWASELALGDKVYLLACALGRPIILFSLPMYFEVCLCSCTAVHASGTALCNTCVSGYGKASVGRYVAGCRGKWDYLYSPELVGREVMRKKAGDEARIHLAPSLSPGIGTAHRRSVLLGMMARDGSDEVRGRENERETDEK